MADVYRLGADVTKIVKRGFKFNYRLGAVWICGRAALGSGAGAALASALTDCGVEVFGSTAAFACLPQVSWKTRRQLRRITKPKALLFISFSS